MFVVVPLLSLKKKQDFSESVGFNFQFDEQTNFLSEFFIITYKTLSFSIVLWNKKKRNFVLVIKMFIYYKLNWKFEPVMMRFCKHYDEIIHYSFYTE